MDLNAANVNMTLLSNSYTAPATQANLNFNIQGSQQVITAQHKLVLQSQTQSMSLPASNIDIGNVSDTGLISLYGVIHVQQYLRLKAWTSNGIYMEFFARTATPNTRSAWMGYGDPTTTQFSITNEIGTTIYLHATDKVILANSLQVGGAIHFIRQSVTPGALGSIVQMYQGGDGHMYFRGPNGYARITGYTVLSGSYP